MKSPLLCLLLVLGLGAFQAELRSQDAAPVPAPAPAPFTPIPNGPPLEMLKAIRNANGRLLEQQAATLLKLEEMEKSSQTIKVLGKRS